MSRKSKKQPTGLCRMCREVHPLINAHVIPNSLYGPLLDKARYMRLETNLKGSYGSNRFTGIYDQTIVCAGCERVFQHWDKYAAEFFRDRDWNRTIAVSFDSNVAAITTLQYDHDKLKLFCMSLLWRAAVSTQEFFQKIKLDDADEAVLREMLKSGDVGSVNDFSLVFGKFDGPPPQFPDIDPRLCWLDPHHTEMGGHSWVKFYVLGWIIYIKLDKNVLTPPYDRTSMIPGKPLWIISRKFATSRELSVMWKMSLTPRVDDEIENLGKAT